MFDPHWIDTPSFIVNSLTLFDEIHYPYFNEHKMFLSKHNIKYFKIVAMFVQIHTLSGKKSKLLCQGQ